MTSVARRTEMVSLNRRPRRSDHVLQAPDIIHFEWTECAVSSSDIS